MSIPEIVHNSSLPLGVAWVLTSRPSGIEKSRRQAYTTSSFIAIVSTAFKVHPVHMDNLSKFKSL